MPSSTTSRRRIPTNRDIAARLRAAATLLEEQGANRFRVAAYRRAADTLETLETPAAELLEGGGRSALVELPHIGHGITAAIVEMVRTGRWRLLDRLEGTAEGETIFETVPGIGPTLAHRLHETLQVDTLEALESAAADGRLEQISGVGPRRAKAIRSYLAHRLGSGTPPTLKPHSTPGVSVVLEVDREYREAAAADRLKRVAPRRFNPQQQRWLPIGHFDHAGWHFTALYSNTARAHRLGRTHDWVVIYFYDHDHREGQHTVVTETHGELAGLRVVRGRERECRDYFRSADQAWAHTREIDRERALVDPAAVFRSPQELAAHPDLTTEEKIELLRRWEYDARELQVAEEEGMSGGDEPALLGQVLASLERLTGGFETASPAPTKQGGV